MIVWLASYPRSGNTMLRAMLRQAFGLHTYSMYDDKTDIGANADVGKQVGHEFLGMDFPEFYFRELNSKRLTLVKTHEKPPDSNLAIYIVRDGRSSIVSWYNMLTRAKKRTDITMDDVILGRNVAFGDWSSHLRAWSPRYNPNILLLFYQDLVCDPSTTIQRISDFIGQQQTAQWRDNFQDLHRLYPEFFPGGSDEKNIGQLTKQESELFWSTHGEKMHEFGFAD